MINTKISLLRKKLENEKNIKVQEKINMLNEEINVIMRGELIQILNTTISTYQQILSRNETEEILNTKMLFKLNETLMEKSKEIVNFEEVDTYLTNIQTDVEKNIENIDNEIIYTILTLSSGNDLNLNELEERIETSIMLKLKNKENLDYHSSISKINNIITDNDQYVNGKTFIQYKIYQAIKEHELEVLDKKEIKNIINQIYIDVLSVMKRFVKFNFPTEELKEELLQKFIQFFHYNNIEKATRYVMLNIVNLKQLIPNTFDVKLYENEKNEEKIINEMIYWMNIKFQNKIIATIVNYQPTEELENAQIYLDEIKQTSSLFVQIQHMQNSIKNAKIRTQN